MKRLLFIAHRVPYPPDKGERVRAFHQLQALARHFDVTLAALAQTSAEVESAGPLAAWCRRVIIASAGGRRGRCRAALSLATGRSATEGFFRSRQLQRQLAGLAPGSGTSGFDLVMGYCSSTLPLVMAAQARARVLDLVDVDSAKWADYAAQSRPPRRWLYRLEAGAVARLEREAVDQCDAVTLVSQAEADVLGHADGKVVVVGNGVDIEYFSPPAGSTGVPSAAGGRAGQAPAAGLVFTGTMDYRPNVEGVCWFAQQVWPGLKARRPELTFTIVGRDPAPEVRRLARMDGITVTGTVPDVRPYLAGAAVAICPLHIARGIQNKILEAMAMALPVVASPAALAGLDLEIGREALQADSPQQWQEQILGLLAKPEQRRAVGGAARRCVQTRYTWSARLAPLVELCIRLAGRNDA